MSSKHIRVNCQKMTSGNHNVISKILSYIHRTKIRKSIPYNVSQTYVYYIKKKIYSSLPKGEFFKIIKGKKRNVEHIIPRFIISGKSGKIKDMDNDIGIIGDPYNIYVTNIKINTYRGHNVFGIVDNPTMLFDSRGNTYVLDSRYAYNDCVPTECDDIEDCNMRRTVPSENIIYKCNNEVKSFPKEYNKVNYTYLNNRGFYCINCRSLNPIYHCTDPHQCVIEPINSEKGKIARTAMFIYLVYIYPNLSPEHKIQYHDISINYDLNEKIVNNFYNDDTIRLYNEWNKQYPPDKDEIIETLYIGSLVRYLNPFVMYYHTKLDKYVFDRNLWDRFFTCEDKIKKSALVEDIPISIVPPHLEDPNKIYTHVYPKMKYFQVDKNFENGNYRFVNNMLTILVYHEKKSDTIIPSIGRNEKDVIYRKYIKYYIKYHQLKKKMGLL